MKAQTGEEIIYGINIDDLQEVSMEVLERPFKSFKSKPNSVPDFQDSDTLIIGSDYSGESKEEPFLVYSFLIVGNKAWMSWEEQRTKLRNPPFLSS
jgi:hypothetical protein